MKYLPFLAAALPTAAAWTHNYTPGHCNLTDYAVNASEVRNITICAPVRNGEHLLEIVNSHDDPTVVYDTRNRSYFTPSRQCLATIRHLMAPLNATDDHDLCVRGTGTVELLERIFEVEHRVFTCCGQNVTKAHVHNAHVPQAIQEACGDLSVDLGFHPLDPPKAIPGTPGIKNKSW